MLHWDHFRLRENQEGESPNLLVLISCQAIAPDSFPRLPRLQVQGKKAVAVKGEARPFFSANQLILRIEERADILHECQCAPAVWRYDANSALRQRRCAMLFQLSRSVSNEGAK